MLKLFSQELSECKTLKQSWDIATLSLFLHIIISKLIQSDIMPIMKHFVVPTYERST